MTMPEDSCLKPSFSYTPLLVCCMGAVLFMLVSVWLYWPEPEVAFRTDDSPVAWLSSAQMWALAILPLRLWRDSNMPRLLCVWLSVAMMGMSFDEQFMFHEHWKYDCIQWTSACSMGWVRELPMLAVGSLGLVTAVYLHRCLPSRELRIMLWTAIGIGVAALVLRATGQPAAVLPYKAALLVTAQAIMTSVLLCYPSRCDQVHSR
jgi:hypothetical protein